MQKVEYADTNWENKGDYGDGKSLLERCDKDGRVVAPTNQLDGRSHEVANGCGCGANRKETSDE